MGDTRSLDSTREGALGKCIISSCIGWRMGSAADSVWVGLIDRRMHMVD